jgi:SAM-dependent methyltransferase
VSGATPLTEEEDAFGRYLLDWLDGHAGELLLERDDGEGGPALGGEWFFAEPQDWAEAERAVLRFAEGRVLDVGAGAGRHSLDAQIRGLEVVAIDVSPGAVEVCRRRGVRDVRLLPLTAVDERLGRFDTVLMMCGNFGLVGSAEEAGVILRRLHAITAPTGRIVLDSIDPYVDSDAADLAYRERNRARGLMPGQVRIRLRYGDRVNPWFDLLNVSPAELEGLAGASGWRVAEVVEGDPPDYYAVLAKTTQASTE